MSTVEHTRTSHVSNESNRMSVYATMRGRITLAELREYLAEQAPDSPEDEVFINYSTVRWERDATTEELADRDARIAESNRRHEAWERDALVRLKAKYEGTAS